VAYECSLQSARGSRGSSLRGTVYVLTFEATPRLVVPRVITPPQHVALSTPWLLEGSVVLISISRPLLAPHALLVAPPLILDRDGAVDEVGKGLVLACLQCPAKAVVNAS
jgi:hypothetical protein